jgi:hypothetical protein
VGSGTAVPVSVIGALRLIVLDGTTTLPCWIRLELVNANGRVSSEKSATLWNSRVRRQSRRTRTVVHQHTAGRGHDRHGNDRNGSVGVEEHIHDHVVARTERRGRSLGRHGDAVSARMTRAKQ